MSVEEALDNCLEDIRYGGLSVEDCIARYPQYASRLRPLLLLTLRLESAQDVRPSREFKSRLRRQVAGESERKPRGIFSLRIIFILLLLLGLIVLLLYLANSGLGSGDLIHVQFLSNIYTLALISS